MGKSILDAVQDIVLLFYFHSKVDTFLTRRGEISNFNICIFSCLFSSLSNSKLLKPKGKLQKIMIEIIKQSNLHSTVKKQETDQIKGLTVFRMDLLNMEAFSLYFFNLNGAWPIRVQVLHGHFCEVLFELSLFWVKYLVERVPDHYWYLIFCQVPVTGSTDSSQYGFKLFLRSLSQSYWNYLNELFPTDEIIKVANVFDDFIAWINVKPLHTLIKSRPIDSFVEYFFGIAGNMELHGWYFLKGFINREEIVNFVSGNPVLIHHIGNILF